MRTLLRACFSATLLAASASAQVPHTLDIDSAASQFTWTGDTSLGPLNGVPNNNFNLSGTVDGDLWAGATQAVGQGQLTGGAGALPYIKGEVPGFLGTVLLTVELVGVEFTATSTAFTVDANGDFTTDVVMTAIAGDVIVTPLIGSQTIIPLAGAQSDPTPGTGSLTTSGGDVGLTVPITAAFSFTDAGTGVTADITLTGTMVADYDCPMPQNYCTAMVNSSGAAASMGSGGTSSHFQNDLVLFADLCPSTQFGLFFFGPGQSSVPVSDGTLCVGGSLVRLPVVQTDAFGSASFALDNQNLPVGAEINPGDTYNFSFWFRDPPGGPGGSNFADGLEVKFCM